MAGKTIKLKTDPVAILQSAGFEIKNSPDMPGWLLASRAGCGILFRKTGDQQIETFRSAGLLLQGRIFRVLDRGFQKFLSDDQKQIPAAASSLEKITSFHQDFKEAVGMPVLFNEALGALTAFTDLDRVTRPIKTDK